MIMTQDTIPRRNAVSRGYFRAIAFDYDGTLTLTPRPSDEVLEAVRAVRHKGLAVILVTGRILDHLRADFPGVDERFDAIVAENGAVIWTPRSGERLLAPPLGAAFLQHLAEAGVPGTFGRILFATDARFSQTILEQIAGSHVEYQLIYNRDALMVLPAGVSKGSGLFEALGELGISHHSVVGIGDAENDHSLMEHCELGVAVANAVPSLQAHADIVLHDPNGWGVADFLRGPLLTGQIKVQPRRWQVEIGTARDGEKVHLPGSQANVLIAGGSCCGKSYLAGLFIEGLAAKGYSVCVLDPEGDHATLGELRGVLAVGGTEPVPPPERIAALLAHRFGSVVVDLSSLGEEEKLRVSQEILRAIRRLRERTGLPHWIVLDEAPQLFAAAFAEEVCGPASHGYCFVTHQPERLPRGLLDQIDVVIVVQGGEPLLRQARVRRRLDPHHLRAGELPHGEAVLLSERRSVRFRPGPRRRPHVRHWHKYLSTRLPPARQFHFRTPHGLAGIAAGNIAEFHHELGRLAPVSLEHHLAQGDFSRWIGGTLQDQELAGRIRAIETGLREHGATVEAARGALVAAIEGRYGE